jgi:Patatin-like phospholipase
MIFRSAVGEAVMPENSATTFEIGLALAGAISAGAYTSGVLDFLFQALEEWENARDEEPDVPAHRATVKVIAGASAGAITGALGVVALARGFQPTKFTSQEMANSDRQGNVRYQSLRCVLPSLYDTWVTHPRLVAANGGIDFLSHEDLDDSGGSEPAKVLSLLNAKLLDDIKKRALLAGGGAQKPTPYPYIVEPLHVYMTISNLRGIPFQVGFGNNTYGMQTHGDRVHYAIGDLGTASGRTNCWIEKDTHTPVSITALPNGGSTATLAREWDQYATCALASSAFPIGLASRQIEVPISHYFEREYPIPVPDGVTIKPNFPPEWVQSTKEFQFLNVDGGLINNNPFDYAQYALVGGPTAKAAVAIADSAVVMVAPFPEPPAFLPDGQPGPELGNIIRALFPTLINQARFRASDLGSALDSHDYSRFLIAPQRKLRGSTVEERYTIACGLLGGFGGFLDEKFRAHDFQLGRRNCQAFLRRTFALPEANPIGGAMKDRAQLKIDADPENQLPERYPIIPLLASAADEVPLPYWPRMSQADLDEVLRRIAGRLKAVAPRLIEAQTASPLLRTIGRIGLHFGRDRLLGYIRLAILSDLVRRDQIEGWELPPALGRQDDVRAILAELASPAFTFRTAVGIARKIHLDQKFVSGILAQLRQAGPKKPYSVWYAGKKGGEELFTLISRKPRGFQSLPGISQIGNWLEPPATDQDSPGRQFGA